MSIRTKKKCTPSPDRLESREDGARFWVASERIKNWDLRKADTLLNYLINTRNVDEHTVEDVASEWNGDLGPIQGGQTVQAGQTLRLSVEAMGQATVTRSTT